MSRIAQDRVEALVRTRPAGEHDPVWISRVADEDLRRQAESVDERVAAGESLPLAGLVFAVKDNIDVTGLPTTAAAPGFAEGPAPVSAPAVERLVAAGALVAGKTNMDQFATGLVGTRSPYGVVASALEPERIAGGSSSGSAVAVARGDVDFSLGTDTAGSGRVPAAFNELVGLKPTRGLVSLRGVVPACRSYDTVSVFAADVALAGRVLDELVAVDPQDPGSRAWPQDRPFVAPVRPRIAVPTAEGLASLGPEQRAAFDRSRARWTELGAEITEIDIAPFLEAGSLLYDGALIAERHEAFGEHLARLGEGIDPNVQAVADRGATITGSALVRDRARVDELRSVALAALQGFDALLVPTAPEHPTIEAVAADPAGVNRRLGTFTNFLNLFDMAAVAIPAERGEQGLFGTSIVVRAFDDRLALDLAARYRGEERPDEADLGVEIAVFGAHLRGQPLNGQLQTVGARFAAEIQTAPTYHLYALPGEPARPALVRTDDGGASIVGELWRVPAGGVAWLAQQIGEPLALGPVALADGRRVLGYVGQGAAGQEITEYGGWLAYRSSLQR